MNDWTEYTIGDLCESISDTYRRNSLMVVLVNTSDVLDGEVLNHEKVKNSNLKGQFKKTFKKNDILYSEIRPANRRYAFVDFDDTSDYIASTKLMVIRANENLIRSKYLYAVLKSESVVQALQLLAETRSGTFPQITFGAEVAPIKLLLPNFETQDRIIAFLEAIEGKISTNKKINDNLAA